MCGNAEAPADCTVLDQGELDKDGRLITERDWKLEKCAKPFEERAPWTAPTFALCQREASKKYRKAKGDRSFLKQLRQVFEKAGIVIGGHSEL